MGAVLLMFQLVPETTDRQGAALIAVGVGNILGIVFQAKAVRVRTVIHVLSSPEARFVAFSVEIAIFAPFTNRERGKPKGICTVAATVPARLRLACRRPPAHRRNQSIPLGATRQMPTIGTDSLHLRRQGTDLVVAALLRIVRIGRKLH